MASVICPDCQYEIPLCDVTGNPVHEVHQIWCKARPKSDFDVMPGDNEMRQKLLDLIKAHKKWIGK